MGKNGSPLLTAEVSGNRPGGNEKRTGEGAIKEEERGKMKRRDLCPACQLPRGSGGRMRRGV